MVFNLSLMIKIDTWLQNIDKYRKIQDNETIYGKAVERL